MISIVLPTYNGKKYIREALDSILSQTEKDWELIIVNDCSTDETPKILQEYADKNDRIRIINNEKNLKLPKSLNRGFAESKGEYLTWTSDDNMYEDNALAFLLQEIRKGYDFVYTNMTYIDEEDHEVSMQTTGSSIWRGNNIGASFLYKREIYEKLGGYNENKYLVEDYEYWLRIAKHYTMHYCPEKIYRYRLHSGSLTQTKVREVTYKRVELLEEQLMDPAVSDDARNQVKLQLVNDYAFTDNDQKLRQTINELSEKKLLKKSSLPRAIKFKYFFGSHAYHKVKRLLRKE